MHAYALEIDARQRICLNHSTFALRHSVPGSPAFPLVLLSLIPPASLRTTPTMPGRDPPDNDPLDAVLRPPIDETPEEKSFRLAAEAEAHRISQEIDESIRQEKLQKKKMRVVRLLLLGQSESGM